MRQCDLPDHRTLALALLGILILFVIGVSLWVGDQYRRLIYPGVSVTAPFAPAVDVGGLSRGAARRMLTDHLPNPADQTLTVRVEDQSRQLTWAQVGQGYDIEAAVDAAYRADRDRVWWLAIVVVLRPTEHVVEAPLKPADPDVVRGYLDAIANEIATAPKDAALAIENGQVVVTDAVPGQQLDAATATNQVLHALASGAGEVELQADAISPRIKTPEPARAAAEAILSRPLTVTVHDPLTGDKESGGYRTTLTAPPSEISTWLWIIERDQQYHLNVRPTEARRWLASSIPAEARQATPDTRANSADGGGEQNVAERYIDVNTTAARITEALRRGEHSVNAVVQHPERTYIVRPGDVFYDIAYLHGFPQWQLEQANPDVEPGLIDVGQELIIPSIDVLFPHPLVPGKRIEVDLPTQTLTAYEDDVPVFEFSVSSGISTTPTLAGQFQILFKEEDAFAQRWRLDMPFFMGFYEEGADFYNGFHELPITAYGTRLSAGVLGYPASFGCIILDVGDAEALYRWADVGTLVRVYGVAPGTPFGHETLNDIAPLTGEPAP